MDETKREQVASFLAAFKHIVASGRGLDLIPRAANNSTLIELGLTAKCISFHIAEYPLSYPLQE